MRSFIQYNKFVSRFRPDPKKEKTEKAPKKGLSYKRKNTGELPIMLEIWEERGPFSQVSGEHLGEFNVSFMAHILPKGQNKYPKFKLKKENIIIISFDEHFQFDHQKKSIINQELWQWVFQLEESLKEEYKLL